MADRKAGAYGTSNDDVGRRTFDREAALERSKAREAQEREDSKLAYQAKLEGRKYFKRAATPEDIKETAARSERRNYQDLIGKVSLVSGSVGQGRRGKGTGVFWCQVCDLNFSNSSEFLEHENSVQHRRAIGEDMTVRIASCSEVRDRLRYLKRKIREAAEDQAIDIDTRLERNRDMEEREREERRKKRNEKRRKTKDPLDQFEIKVEGDGVIS